MTSRSRWRKLPLLGILAVTVCSFLISVVVVFVATATVTGHATLPNGSKMVITTKGRGFGVSNNTSETRIEAGRYVVAIDDALKLSVNGSELAQLEDEPKSYDLVVDGQGLKIRCAERIIAQVR